MKSFILTAAFCLLVILVYSQSAKQTQTVSWKTLSVTSNGNSRLKWPYNYEFDRSICYLQDSSALVPVGYDKEKQYGIVKINHLNKVQWQIMLPANPEWVAKKNGNAIVFYIEKSKNAVLHAVTINLTTHKILNDQIISKQNGLESDYIFENTPDGEFEHLIVRTSARKERSIISGTSAYDKWAATTKLELIYLNERNEASTTDVTQFLNGGLFLTSVTTKQKNFIISVLNNDSITVKLFKAGAVLQKELSIPVLYRNKLSVFPFCTVDTLNQDEVILMAYTYQNEAKDEILNVASVNFTSGKIIKSEEQILDKKYAQVITDEFKRNNPGEKIEKIIIPDRMKPTAIVANDNYICVIKQMRNFAPASNNNIQYMDHPVTISCFDRNLKLQNNIIINRGLSTFTADGRPIGYNLKGNTLYVVASTLIGTGKFGAFVAKGDITNGKVSTEMIDKGDFLENSLLEGGATLWFPDAFIVNLCINSGGFGSRKVNTVLSRMTY